MLPFMSSHRHPRLPPLMVGRHLLRAVCGGEGMALIIIGLRDELQRAIVLTGMPSFVKINRSILS